MYETRSPIDDRFGFSTKGTFRCSLATERIALILTVITGLLLFVAGYNLIYYVYKEHTLYAQTDPTQYAGLASLTFIGFMIVLITGEAVAAKLILSGRQYRYSANENVFSFSSKKDNVRKTDIFYSDVVSVKYSERKLFGKISRGYTVTIVTRSRGSITIEYLFNRSIPDRTTRNTPFHIIEERVVMLRQKTEKEAL